MLFTQRLACNSVIMATLGAEFNEQEPVFLRQKLSQLARWIGSERSISALERISVFALIGVAIATVLYLTRQGAGVDPLAPAAAANGLAKLGGINPGLPKGANIFIES